MKRKLLSIVLILCMLSMTLPPMAMVANAAADNEESGEMNALEALGIDTSQAPEGYDPNSRDNPYGRDTVTVNPVGEFYSVGLSEITTSLDLMPATRNSTVSEYVYEYVYNDLQSTLYGHEKWNISSAASILSNEAVDTIQGADSTVKGAYMDSQILSNDKPRLQGIEVDTTLGSGEKLALTAVVAGNFDGNKTGKKAQAAMVYAGALNKNGGLYLKIGDINGEYGTPIELLPEASDIGNPDAALEGTIIETFDSAPYLLQNYLKVTTGDYNGDGCDEIAVYIPEYGKSRIQVYKLRTTSGGIDYTAGSQWDVVWTYSLMETTYVSNMVSLISGDFNSDGTDDLAATWGYYYGPEDNKGSTAVVLFGNTEGKMLTESREFPLTYGQSEIIRGAFAFGDITGSDKDTLVLGGQLNSDIEDGNLYTRFVALYSWNGTEFVQGKATNYNLFEKDDKGKLVYAAMTRPAGTGEVFYSSPLCVTNLDIIGQGLGEDAKLYIDSLVLQYGEDGLSIYAALDASAQMQQDMSKLVSYVEYGLAVTDLVGLGKESMATMQQTFSEVDIETVSEEVTESRTYVYYEYETYYRNWVHRLFGIRSKRLVQRTEVVTSKTTLNDSLRTYTPGKTYKILLDVSESYTCRQPVDASTSICVANTDDDTTFLNYSRKYFTYSDPEILAVLASPPYFKDLMDRDDLSGRYNESTTSYSKSEGGSDGVTASATISIGPYVSFEQSIEVFGVEVAKIEAEVAYKASFTYDYEYTKSLEQTVTYTAIAGEDMVAFYSIPLEIFEFQASVPDGKGGYKTQLMNINVPHEASVKLIPLEDYEAIAADYDVLPQISGNVLTHTIGDPATYPGSTNGYDVVAEYDGTPSSVGFSSAGAAQGQEIAMGTETTHAFTGSIGVETKAGAGAGGVTLGITAGIEGGAGYVMTSTSGSSFSGEMQNMPDEAEPYGYGYNWRIFCYKYDDGMSNFPVVNYIVSDVTTPPELPSDFAQDISATTDDSIALTWSYDKSVAGFVLYRHYEFPEGSGSYEYAYIDASTGIPGDDGRLHYKYTDSGKGDTEGGLAPYTDYSYQIQTVRAAVPAKSIKSEILVARTKTAAGYPDISLEGEGLQDGVLPIYPDSTADLTAVVQNPEDYSEGFDYQWQALIDGIWTDLIGKSDATLTFSASGSADQAKYRCRINTIYYDTTAKKTFYITAYSDTASVEYSKRTPRVALNRATGDERFTATTEGSTLNLSLSLVSGNTGHIPAPRGNVTFVVTGMDYSGSVVGELKENGTQTDGKEVTTATAHLDNLLPGVYEVTAIYGGSRYFKSLTVSDAITVLVGDATGYQLNLMDGTGKVTRFTYGGTITPVLNEIKLIGNELVIDQLSANVTFILKDSDGKVVGGTLTSGFNTPAAGSYVLSAYIGANTEPSANRSFIVAKKPITVEIPDKTVGGGNVTGNEPQLQLQDGSSMAFSQTLESLGLTYIARNTANNVVTLNNSTLPGKYYVTPVPSDTSDISNYDITYIKGIYTIIGKTYDVTYEALKLQDLLAGSVDLNNDGNKFSASEWLLFYSEPYNGYEMDTWTTTLAEAPYTVLDTQSGGLTYSYQMKDEPIHVTAAFKAKEVTLTTLIQGTGGTIIGPKYFTSGSVVTPGAELSFKAVPNTGYHFVKWMKAIGTSQMDLSGESATDGTNTLMLTMGVSNTRLYAVFARDSYTLTLDGNLVASYWYDHDMLDTTPSIEKVVSSGAVIPGDTIVTARVRTGYQAESNVPWKQDGVQVTAAADNQSYIFTMLKDTTISVPTVRGKYTVTASADNGTVTFTLDDIAATDKDLAMVLGGTKVTATATPDYGYEFDYWTENGQVSKQSRVFLKSELGSNLDLTAHFKKLDTYGAKVTLNNPLRASINYTIKDNMGRTAISNVSAASGQTIPVFKGDTLSITIVPKENFMVGKWIIDGVVLDSRQKTYTLESIGENHELQVDLAPQVSCRVYYSGDISLATSDGKSFSSGAMIGCGTTVAFYTAPAAGKMVKNWTLNGTAVENKYGEPYIDIPYIIDGLLGTANVSVAFEDILTHSVMISAENIEYTAAYEPDFGGLIRDGAAGIFTFRAKAGYRLDKSVLEQTGSFDYISYDGNTETYTCRIDAIHSDYSISLKAKELYGITCNSATNGTVKTIPVNAAAGDKVSIETAANSTYTVDSIQAIYFDTAGQIVNLIIIDNTFEMPAAAVTVTATFKYTGGSSNNGGGGGRGHGGSGTKVVTINPADIQIPADISGTSAVLSISDEMLALLLAEGAKTGTVVLDASKLNATINSVVIPNGALAKILDAIQKKGSGLTQLSIILSNSVVTFDSKALDNILKNNGNGDITLTVKEMAKNELNESQRALAGDGIVLDIALFVGSKQISGFGGGNVSVSLPYELKAGETADGLVVWFISDKGKLTHCTSSYLDGMLTFTTSHFSRFIAAYFPFMDLKDTDWYYESAVYAFKNNLFRGTEGSSFSPKDNMTRGMLVTVLYRYEGTSESFTNSFSDIKAGDWYMDPVSWANAKGIVSGVGDGSFHPNDNITREQLAVILYRYSKIRSFNIAAAATSLDSFKDSKLTSGYAAEAMKWALGSGLISGKGNGILDPKGKATRAEVAAILMRFTDKAKK